MTQIIAKGLSGEEVALGFDVVAGLQAKLCGELLRPGYEKYHEARQVWNGMIDRHPALIARCVDAVDVAAAVNFARTHHLLTSVRGGGHNVAGFAVADGALMIDLSPMKKVRVDARSHTVTAQAGSTINEVDRATTPFGLAVPLGVVSDTGIAGLTLNGGMSWLRRKHGLSVDNLIAAEVVTAEGKILRVSEAENADLFWAIRGGGGNFGIVTSFTYRAQQVGPNVMFANVFYPMEQAQEVIGRWKTFTANAPDEATTDIILWQIPALPPIPEHLHGVQAVIVAGMYAGEAEEGEKVLQPLREFGTPLLDASGILPYSVVQTMFDPLFPKGTQRRYWKSLYLNGMEEAATEFLVSRAAHRPSPHTLISLRHMGGAVSRVPEADTAMGNRSGEFLLSIDSTWETTADDARNIAWTRDFWNVMQPFSNGGVYLNFPGSAEENPVVARAGYGANYDRLAFIKRKYDPQNLFRLNQNIPPK